VEELVASYPVVAEVAVIGAPDAGLGQVVVAVVVARENQQLDPDELRAFCKSRVAIYKVPARIVLVDELPKTDTGKLSKRMLVERYGSSEASA
jgi:acyl-CoA synthetase (AMP-forming)/AMP-acid ligase II